MLFFFIKTSDTKKLGYSEVYHKVLITERNIYWNETTAMRIENYFNTFQKILQICGIAEEVSVRVRQLYTDTRSEVRFGSSLSEEFTIETGVKQGCNIAPDHFNCVIDNIMNHLLRRCNLGIQLGEYQLTDLDYADDLAIFAPSACSKKL